MLSNPLQRYSPYHNSAVAAPVGAPVAVSGPPPAYNTQLAHAHLQTDGFGGFRQDHGYAFQPPPPLDRDMAVTKLNLSCEYMREKKKRGKASRKDLAERAAAQAAVNGSQAGDGTKSNDQGESSATTGHGSDVSTGTRHANDPDFQARQTTVSSDMSDHSHLADDTPLERDGMENGQAIDLNGYGRLSTGYERHSISGGMMGSPSYSNDPSHNMSGYPLSFGLLPQSPAAFNSSGYRMGNSPLTGYQMGGGASPGWGVGISSPTGHFQPQQSQHQVQQKALSHAGLRYPVLEPLAPHLTNIIPFNLACDLLDLYFSSSSSAQMHPMSPYVLGFLKPLIHTPMGETLLTTGNANIGAVGMAGLGAAMPGSLGVDGLSGEAGSFGAAGQLDDVATYIHLATVVSASEYKGASVRWWNIAWSLARELKLGREIPPGNMPANLDRNDADHDSNLEDHDIYRSIPGFVTEEEREERRRIWWLLYIVDRHLALCYNRPMFLLDIECEALFQPFNDNDWQKGDFSTFPDNAPDQGTLGSASQGFGAQGARLAGPQFECRGHSIFGYFLPLMTILGEVVDLHHAKNHPRFGIDFRAAHEWDAQAEEIRRHLEIYEQSLKRFEEHHLPRQADGAKGDTGRADGGENSRMTDTSSPSAQSVYTNASNRMTENEIQARITVAYGTHVMHVLHILLADKWDPISLLDDNDLWISTQGFITATGHAVSAADAIAQILEFDPGLEFMPFFFGVYLLQGSFLLLLIADKLQFEASPNVIRACEIIVRAHEACVVTLNTEYQRNFSKVMRSALAVVRGRVPQDLGEQHQRRRELLGLYRWTGGGTGLAL
ncbi:transcriptional activator xlnR [Purpureocillium lavendulum]|uniref:Transcriptional activator xlnR n=1 Tax=Purpureocillium lavendulum TaxID=1247861 RepID=A0AB34FZR3_9HYPO|nr:transcriptional activator xlnR [Purpureocillium lavendulum]